ncbi:MAG TPA: hypothetical protein VG603_09535, partial [Chitinophagales bacterium]|nr:hypothetical protein [Chitinophagales bacterium]
TQEWTVRNELLFAPGELVDPVKFADTEKNIWERGTFKDLKILLEPVGESGDTINVQVIVQERFSWSISTSAQYNKAVVGVEFCNVAGMPQSLEQKMAFNYRKDNPYTVYGGYEYDNIRHSHIDVMAEYQYENLSKGADVALIRNFFSSTCRWAGYVQGGLYRDLGSLPNPYAAAIPTNIYYNWQDIWLATSMPFDEGLTGKNSALRWVVAGRLYRYQYLQRPYKISEDGSQIFLNHSYILGSVGLATWDYYVAQDVFSLHKSEYFSKGFNASLIFGLDNDEEYGQRFYSGVRLNCGNYFHGFGYLNSRISYGGFSGQSGYNQLLLKISQRIFSETVQLGPKMRMRQIVSASVNYGFRRPDDKLIAMNNYNGVRALYVNNIRGNRTYVLNFENDFYANFKVLGFSSALFAFADLALTQQKSYRGGQFDQAVGLGIRLRNLSLGIGYFEVSFVYYPHLDIPGFKPYTVTGTTDLTRGINPDNLFVAGGLSPDN